MTNVPMTSPAPSRSRKGQLVASSVMADERDRARFWRWLGVITVVGLAIRVAYVLIERRDVVIGGDAIYYHFGANLLADGHGFIVPLDFARGLTRQAADHPPLYLLWLAFPSKLGLDTPVWHMLWSCLLGAGTIVVVGLAGREISGARVGIIAAALAAIYPNIWSHDGFLQSETTGILAATGAILLAYRYWHRPSVGLITALGLVCGAAALTRPELLLLLPFVMAPLVALTRTVDLRTKLKWLLVASAATAVVLAPWVGYNLTRFEHPVFLSTGQDVTLLTASCDTTYYGSLTGYWSQNCGIETPRRFDQSQKALAYREAALDYISAHKARVPVVVLARWGRITGLFRPTQQARLDHFVEGRERWVAWSSLGMFYVIASLAILGAIVLRRRRVPMFPLVALPAIVLISTTLTFATNRYRAIAESALVLLAAVAIDAGIRWYRARRRPPADVPAGRVENDAGERVLAGS
jgi:4-amino-4-deoxy-L-arabinose transferase-like glycosyltransferase